MIRFAASLVLVTLVSTGCAVPGQQLGVNVSHSNMFDSNDDDLSARADIFPINASTIKLLSDQSLVQEQLAKDLPVPNANEFEYQYRIGAQDILRITVWDHPELNNPSGVSQTDAQGRTVNNDGTLFYPYVGMIQVAGKTVQELRAYLEKSLQAAIRSPQVDVTVQTFRSQRVVLSGEVKTPGVQPITDIPLRMLDLLGAAGGLTSEADVQSATIMRKDKVYKIDLYSLIYKGDANQNILLQAGDRINVPEKREKKIFVLGEVIRPSSLPMPRGNYTLTEALSDAGGVSQITANSAQIYVIRANNATRPQIFQLDAASPTALVLADSFRLAPRDVVFVDAATVSRINRVISQILPISTALQAGKYVAQ